MPSQVISAVIAGSSQAALGALPKKHSLQVYVNRSRNGVNAPPPNPRIREEIQVPDRYRYYTAANGNEELFLLMDSGRHDPDR